MASKRLVVTDKNEVYESVKVQIEVARENANSTKSTGKVFQLNGHEYPISRFGSWALHEIQDAGEVDAILASGGIILAITWAFSRAYREVEVWINNVRDSQFTLDVKRSKKKIVLDEIRNGTMVKRLQESFKSIGIAAAYKGLKVELIKPISDEVPTKKRKKNAHTHTQRFSEPERLIRLLESERVADFMKEGHHSCAFMALRRLLEDEECDVARLQMLLRLAICALYLNNNEEVEAVFPQIIRLMKTLIIPAEEIFLYEQDYKALSKLLVISHSNVMDIELSFAFVEIIKAIPDATDRLDKMTAALISICCGIGALLSSDPSACLKSEVLQYFKKMNGVVEFMGKQTDCDPLVRAQNIYYVEFNIAEVKNTLGKRTAIIFRDNSMEFKRISGCWADLPLVITRLRHHPETSKYMKEPEFCGDLIEIGKNPSLLQSKIKDPKIALANEILMSDFAIITSLKDIVDKTFSAAEAGTSTESKKEKKSDKPVDKKQEAQKEKVKGNCAYMKRQFEKALAHYDKAISLDPTNALLYSNKAAVFITQDRLTEAKSACLTALDLTQKTDRHDDKDVAKVMARLARTEFMDGKIHVALPIYRRSLQMNFDPKVQDQMKECEEMVIAATFFFGPSPYPYC